MQSEAAFPKHLTFHLDHCTHSSLKSLGIAQGEKTVVDELWNDCCMFFREYSSWRWWRVMGKVNEFNFTDFYEGQLDFLVLSLVLIIAKRFSIVKWTQTGISWLFCVRTFSSELQSLRYTIEQKHYAEGRIWTPIFNSIHFSPLWNPRNTDIFGQKPSRKLRRVRTASFAQLNSTMANGDLEMSTWEAFAPI